MSFFAETLSVAADAGSCVDRFQGCDHGISKRALAGEISRNHNPKKLGDRPKPWFERNEI